MLSPSYSISPKDLWNAIATRDATQFVDVRRHDAYEQSPHLLPGAVWRDAGKAKQWIQNSIWPAQLSPPAKPATR